jgi:uridylate kinase
MHSRVPEAKVYTAIRMEPVGELFAKDKVVESLKSGEVCIVAGGTGNPYFTTDTASALRGIELEADAMLKGTSVDGIYTADPEKNPDATRFDTITFR